MVCPTYCVSHARTITHRHKGNASPHIMARGIERREIFVDDQDRHDFLKDLGLILEQTETACFAWSLMSNHFHLVLRRRDFQEWALIIISATSRLG
jgi:REP element-mobilizing transposase RayT